MGETNCDDCGEQPYVAPVTGDYSEYHDFEEEPDAELWCECAEDRAIAFTDNEERTDSRPDYWGQSGGRFVCYECGEMPRLKTVTSGGGKHPTILYRLSCRCEKHSWGVEFGWRSIMPDKWKDDMDSTKWPDVQDEIEDAVEEHGPISRSELAKHVDLPEEGVQCLTIHMCREHDLFRYPPDGLLTMDQVIDGPYDMTDRGVIEKRDSRPDETGIRSGKGTGFFSRLLGLGGED